jgi:hypothetical protein
MKNFVFEVVDDCIVCLGSKNPPSDAEWDAYIAALEACLKKNDHKVNIIVITRGGAPTPAQRHTLNETTARHNSSSASKVAVLTSSAIARGVVTALSWFSPVYKAFAEDDLDGAVDFLDVPSHKVFSIRGAVRALEKQIPREAQKR